MGDYSLSGIGTIRVTWFSGKRQSLFSITVLQDQGNPPQYSEAIVYVNVIDADDQNPKFADDRYFATLPDHATQVN